MNATTYTPELADAGRLASLIKCTQPDKRIIAAARRRRHGSGLRREGGDEGHWQENKI